MPNRKPGYLLPRNLSFPGNVPGVHVSQTLTGDEIVTATGFRQTLNFLGDGPIEFPNVVDVLTCHAVTGINVRSMPAHRGVSCVLWLDEQLI